LPEKKQAVGSGRPLLNCAAAGQETDHKNYNGNYQQQMQNTAERLTRD